MRSDDLHLAGSRGHGEAAVSRGRGEQMTCSTGDLGPRDRLIARVDDSAGDGARSRGGGLLRPAWRERQQKQRQEHQEAVAKARTGKNVGHVEAESSEPI